jgi:hypothetical protein
VGGHEGVELAAFGVLEALLIEGVVEARLQLTSLIDVVLERD